MDGETRRSSPWPLVFGGVVAFGLLVTASGVVLGARPVAVQGIALTVAGLVGLVFTGLRDVPVPRRLPSPIPWTLPVGALVLAATAVESARRGVSSWAPLGLLVGVVLLSVPIRALPAPPRPLRRPGPAVVLVLTGVVLLIGYRSMRHLRAPEPGDLPSYLAAVGLPFVAAVAAGALAVLAARRGGVVGFSAGGGLALMLAGLYLADAAGSYWLLQRWFPGYGVDGPGVAFIAVQTSSAYESSSSITFVPGGATTALLVVGLLLTVTGWWWAAARRRAG